MPQIPDTSVADSPRPFLLWVGETRDAELHLARSGLSGLVAVAEAATPAAAVAMGMPGQQSPAITLLAAAVPGGWTLADAVLLSRHWPLTPVVSVATSLIDGRRRSGPALPGVEEVPWTDLPGRVAWWLHDMAAGRPGTLGMPATSRREERIMESAVRVREWSSPQRPRPRISVAAARAGEVECLVDLLSAAGAPVTRRTCGRPPLDEPADVLVWDVSALTPSHLAWLQILTANQPALRVVLLDSFPRGDSTTAALRAGAVAVLARPVSLEALAGTLIRLETAAFALGGEQGRG
ncbi:MAG: hypothetical protein DWI03_07780 [Planctomycetota bacterium]|nr:MAG: hypothetical protein DWI03_07780 [Planctomycetota bacterium]